MPWSPWQIDKDVGSFVQSVKVIPGGLRERDEVGRELPGKFTAKPFREIHYMIFNVFKRLEIPDEKGERCLYCIFKI